MYSGWQNPLENPEIAYWGRFGGGPGPGSGFRAELFYQGVQLTHFAADAAASPPGGASVWSPDGSRLAASVLLEDDTGYDLFVIHLDGTVQRLTGSPGPDDKSDLSPSWSPDGRQIAYVELRGSGQVPQIVVMEADGSGRRPLSTGVPPYMDLAWSPDGRWFAFTSREGFSGDLYAVRADGSGLVRLAEDIGLSGGFSWSPTSQGVALGRKDPADSVEVTSVKVDGATGEELTLVSCPGTYPAWSADGGHIAFVSRAALGRVSVVNGDGTDLRLAAGDTACAWPTWSPDGRYLAYETDLRDQPCSTPNCLGVRAVGIDWAYPTEVTLFRDAVAPAWRPHPR